MHIKNNLKFNNSKFNNSKFDDEIRKIIKNSTNKKTNYINYNIKLQTKEILIDLVDMNLFSNKSHFKRN